MGSGRVQEEIRFCICPELIISMLIMGPMDNNEAVIVTVSGRGGEREGRGKGGGGGRREEGGGKREERGGRREKEGAQRMKRGRRKWGSASCMHVSLTTHTSPVLLGDS